MTDLKEAISKLKPIFEEYTQEKISIQKMINQQGTVPEYICKECKTKEIEEVIKFDENINNSIYDFIDWINSNKIRKIRCDKENIHLTSKERVVEKQVGKSILLSTDEYEFRFPISKFKKKSFANLFNFEFNNFSFCKHIKTETDIKSLKALPIIINKIHKIPYFFNNISQDPANIFERDKKIKELRLICRNCYDRINKIGCETAILERGFIYQTVRCSFESILLRNLLQKYNIKFNEKEIEFYNNEFEYFLPEFNALITKNTRELAIVIEKIRPEIIISFGKKENIVNFLQYNSDIIIFDDAEKAQQRLFLFDKNKKIEESVEKIVLHIVSKLFEYYEETKGKEHDRIIEAFLKVGQDLGFIVQKEFSQKGARVDLIWLDRNGKIFTAIEVETSAQWKKDIVSTWETEPKLAIVVSHYKSEKGIKDILQYVLLENMPHKLLFINNLTKKAYLIERNFVLKYFDILEKKEIKSSPDIFEY